MASLYYIVGPSGSGKDAVVQYFRESFATDLQVIIAHRYITRISDHTENSIALTQDEFDLRLEKKLFAMAWNANHLSYGVGVEIDAWLSAGMSVIVNGSREYIPVAVDKYSANIHVIFLDVSDDVLQERLQSRGREDDQGIDQRMERHQRLKSLLVTGDVRTSRIVNESSIEDAALQLKGIVVSNQ